MNVTHYDLYESMISIFKDQKLQACNVNVLFGYLNDKPNLRKEFATNPKCLANFLETYFPKDFKVERNEEAGDMIWCYSKRLYPNIYVEPKKRKCISRKPGRSVAVQGFDLGQESKDLQVFFDFTKNIFVKKSQRILAVQKLYGHFAQLDAPIRRKFARNPGHLKKTLKRHFPDCFHVEPDFIELQQTVPLDTTSTGKKPREQEGCKLEKSQCMEELEKFVSAVFEDQGKLALPAGILIGHLSELNSEIRKKYANNSKKLMTTLSLHMNGTFHVNKKEGMIQYKLSGSNGNHSRPINSQMVNNRVAVCKERTKSVGTLRWVSEIMLAELIAKGEIGLTTAMKVEVCERNPSEGITKDSIVSEIKAEEISMKVKGGEKESSEGNKKEENVESDAESFVSEFVDLEECESDGGGLVLSQYMQGLLLSSTVEQFRYVVQKSISADALFHCIVNKPVYLPMSNGEDLIELLEEYFPHDFVIERGSAPFQPTVTWNGFDSWRESIISDLTEIFVKLYRKKNISWLPASELFWAAYRGGLSYTIYGASLEAFLRFVGIYLKKMFEINFSDKMIKLLGK